MRYIISNNFFQLVIHIETESVSNVVTCQLYHNERMWSEAKYDDISVGMPHCARTVEVGGSGS
jgi:hypothetical protein